MGDRLEFKTYYSNKCNDYVLGMQDLNSKLYITEIVAWGYEGIKKYINENIKQCSNTIKSNTDNNILGVNEYLIDLLKQWKELYDLITK